MMLEIILEKIRQPERVILTGRSRPSRKRSYLKQAEPALKRKTIALWNAMREAMSAKDLELALQTGSLPQALQDEWNIIADEWLESALMPEYQKAIEYAGNNLFSALLRPRKAAEFNSVTSKITQWMVNAGGALIRELTIGQFKTINALLHHQVFIGVASPSALAKMLKPMIGLLEREANAVANYKAELIAQGLAAEQIEKMTIKYADFLLNNRAERIARTELCKAYEFGQAEAITQMQEQGLVDEVEKEWMTSQDDRVCEICSSLDGEIVRHEENFSIGIPYPPAHPECHCDVGYTAVRR